MNKITTIEERVLAYYNDLVKNNVIPGEAPVTLEWMKRQRILEGRGELDIRFGHVVVDSILGEKTPLAKAEHYLAAVRKYNKYELLSKIAQLLAEECKKMLGTDNIAYRKYSCLDSYVLLDIIDIKGSNVNLVSMINTSRKSITPFEMECISNFISAHNNINDEEFSDVCFGIYILNLVYSTLSKAFNEIRNQVECITK